jgi:signal transduction histidine kinase
MDPTPDSEGRPPPSIPPEGWLAGGGEMGALMRSTNWSATPLGPIEQWPKSLKTMLGVMLGSRFPMLLWWGPDLLHLYNDAYRPILRDKHPASLAAPAAEVWAEVWEVAGPMARGVLAGSPATWTEDLQLFVNSAGMAEETYFTFSYSPVPGDDGKVGGVLNTVQETTAKVQGERQIRMLHDLVARAGEARSEADAHRTAMEVLATNALDIPFLLLYVMNDAADAVQLAGHCGLKDYTGPAMPASIAISASAPAYSWPLRDVLMGAREMVIDDLSGRFGPLPAGPWNGRPERALILPLVRTGQQVPVAFLIAGVSPHRVLDDRYRRFFHATAVQLMSVIINAQAYEAETERAEALAAIDRAKTSFFSNVSHEFRTPLTLILGPIEDAVASMQGLSGEPLRLVRRNAHRLMKLVNALLDFSRAEAGRAQVAFEPTDLAEVTSYLGSAFRSAIERTGLAFHVDCPPLPEPIYIDRELWEKIVLNLLSNALKFTFDGSISLAVRWCGDHAEVAVRDTGTGIPQAELPHLFERFHRVAGARSRTHEGSGIGLALVHDLILLHGGTIQVESALDAGTTFTVSLPSGIGHLPAGRLAAQRAAGPEARGAAPFMEEALRWDGGMAVAGTAVAKAGTADPAFPAVESGREEPSRPRILIVDDNADLRSYIVRLLDGLYQLTTANDGVAGLEAARRIEPTLILSDVMMPRLDGLGLLKALRADRKLGNTPFILLSARAGDESTIEGLEAGADDYLAKPFAARELLARVRTHVELALQREALMRAKETAESVNRELSTFSYSVAHDLRAPLRSIDGFSHMLSEDYGGQLGATGQGYLGRIRNAIRHMSLLIDGLLALARITQSELHREGVDVSALAHAAIARLKAGEPGRRVQVIIQDGLHADGDPRLLTVMLDNLIGNAWKFTGKRDQARIEVGVTPHEDQATYFVRDNGAGFDMTHADRLFGVFQRLHSEADFVGTGIGLATVQRVVNRHRGRVWAEGMVDQGATFFFTLSPQDRVA